ncbi:MAG: hypothetical protein ABI045_06265 [Flavobacteriales bacterium]
MVYIFSMSFTFSLTFAAVILALARFDVPVLAVSITFYAVAIDLLEASIAASAADLAWSTESCFLESVTTIFFTLRLISFICAS